MPLVLRLNTSSVKAQFNTYKVQIKFVQVLVSVTMRFTLRRETCSSESQVWVAGDAVLDVITGQQAVVGG